MEDTESCKDKVRAHYASGGEEHRAEKSRSNSVEFYYTEKILLPYFEGRPRAVEIGCATGYYAMKFSGLCENYRGIDLSAENIEIFHHKILESELSNVTAEVGDATKLDGVPDGSFDIVLCLGPMYHLPRLESAKVFAECERIASRGALLAFAYINRIGVYAGACCNDRWRDIYPNPRTSRFVFDKSTDDEKPDVFHFTSPEEMTADASANKLTVLDNRGLDFFFAASAIDGMTDEQYKCWLELSDKMSASTSCVGLSNHALLICTKP